MSIATALAPIVDLVYPPRCPLCGQAIAAQTGVCAACWNELVIPGAPACERCSRPFGDGIVAGSFCAPCLANPPRHDGIAAATLYNDASRRLVLSFKHGRRLALAPLMARLMLPKLDFDVADWLLVPVPLHRWRLWRRGFNQAAVLAAELSRRTGAALVVDALERNKATPSLGGLRARERRRALSGAIAVRSSRRERIAGRKIVLVDDVLTSGATSDSCITALRRGGADKVRIACFARVLAESLN